MIYLLFSLVLGAPWKTTTEINSEAFFFHYMAIGEKTVYALDAKDGVITEYTRDGKIVRQFGELGPGPGELQNPGHMVEVKKGVLWVKQSTGSTISVFVNGKYQSDIKPEQPVLAFSEYNGKVLLVPTSSQKPFSVRDESGEEISTFELPEHDLPLPKGAHVKGIWHQAYVTPYKGGLALTWFWLPTLGFVDAASQRLRVWDHELYPPSPVMTLRKGTIPLEFTGRTISNGPGDRIYIGACRGDSTNCKDLLVVDIENHKLLEKVTYEPGVAQLEYRHNVFGILTMDGDIHLIDPKSMK